MEEKRGFTSRRRFLGIAAIVLLVILAIAGRFIGDMGYRLTSYAAKQACSLVFVTGQPLEDVLGELQEDNPFIKYVDVKIRNQDNEAIATIAGLFRKRAVYRPPLGATLMYPGYEKAIRNFPRPDLSSVAESVTDIKAFVPMGSADVNLLNRINLPQLKKAFTYAFDEPDDPESHRRTRAAMVLWNDHIIAEKYHPDFGPDSLLLGWSMSKSVTNLLIGRRIHQGGNLSLSATGLRKEWLHDDRRSITLEQLLRMESGLYFEETYSPLASVLTMLYRKPDMGTYAASFKKEANTGQASWYYSSGTSNILNQQLRRSFKDNQAYVHFLWLEFLLPLGIRTAQLEFDASGTWVGSSYMYATARGWARIGKLVLNNGKWDGQQFLPVDWIEKSAIPTASYRENSESGDPPGMSYGMHWWLNRKDKKGRNWMPSVPEDAVIASGHFGQYVVTIPSRQLIIVRLGLSKGPKGWDLEQFLIPILAATHGN